MHWMTQVWMPVQVPVNVFAHMSVPLPEKSAVWLAVWACEWPAWVMKLSMHLMHLCMCLCSCTVAFHEFSTFFSRTQEKEDNLPSNSCLQSYCVGCLHLSIKKNMHHCGTCIVILMYNTLGHSCQTELHITVQAWSVGLGQENILEKIQSLIESAWYPQPWTFSHKYFLGGRGVCLIIQIKIYWFQNIA